MKSRSFKRLQISLLAVGAIFFLRAFGSPPAQNTQAGARTPTVAERLGYPANSRLLMIHADDLGMMRSVDRASFEALEKGWVTSASILVVCPWFPEVASFARAHPDLDLGIHLALNSEWTSLRWGPITGRTAASLLDADGYMPLVEEAVVQHADRAEAERELRGQIEKARAAGIHITHFDSHMGTLLDRPDLFALLLQLGRDYQLPVRVSQNDLKSQPSAADYPALLDGEPQMRPGVPKEKWLDAYKAMLQPLPPGVYHLTVHLGYDDAELRGATADHPDWGAAWRQSDFDLVRSPEFQRFLREQGFILVKWTDLARALPNKTEGSK
jgi:chitin disaccharide deacetylase